MNPYGMDKISGLVSKPLVFLGASHSEGKFFAVDEFNNVVLNFPMKCNNTSHFTETVKVFKDSLGATLAYTDIEMDVLQYKDMMNTLLRYQLEKRSDDPAWLLVKSEAQRLAIYAKLCYMKKD